MSVLILLNTTVNPQNVSDMDILKTEVHHSRGFKSGDFVILLSGTSNFTFWSWSGVVGVP